jgi:hypothetical protein
MGSSPTRPRTPSVPKYFPAHAVFLPILACRSCHNDGIHGFPHVMHAHDGRAPLDRQQRGNDAGHMRSCDITPGQRTEHGLARHPASTGAISASSDQILEQGHIVRQGLAEAEARVDQQRYPGRCPTSRAARKAARDRSQLPSPRRRRPDRPAWSAACRAYASDTGRSPEAATASKAPGASNPLHVVDHVGAGRQHGGHDFRLHGVHRKGRAGIAQAFQHRQYPPIPASR